MAWVTCFCLALACCKVRGCLGEALFCEQTLELVESMIGADLSESPKVCGSSRSTASFSGGRGGDCIECFGLCDETEIFPAIYRIRKGLERATWGGAGFQRAEPGVHGEDY